MPKYEKAWLAVKAKEFGVPRDTLEKVYRLRDVLKFFDEVPILRENLALKGGTAINLLTLIWIFVKIPLVKKCLVYESRLQKRLVNLW